MGLKEGNRRDFLGQDFFFTVLTLLMKRIARMDLADGLAWPPGKVQGDSAQLINVRDLNISRFAIA